MKMLVNKHSGAALLAVLIMAVMMAVLLGVATTTMQSRLALATQSKQKLQDQAQVYAKTNHLVYLLATQRLTAAGISQGIISQGLSRNEEGFWELPIIGDELRDDGEPLLEENGLRYSIQNESGLIPINSSTQYWIKRWLQNMAYSTAEQAKLGDTLADYADPDNWRRPGGGEQASYQNQFFSGPANFLLQSCSELWKVTQWKELLTQQPSIIKHCSLRRWETLNLNSVPHELWQLFWPNSAQKVRGQRQKGIWLQSDMDILALEPALLLVGDDYYSTLGGDKFRLRVSKAGATMSVRMERGIGLNFPFSLRQVPQN